MQKMDLNRLMRLAQKTGDKLIVTDPSGGDAMVILPLAEYESLLEGGVAEAPLQYVSQPRTEKVGRSRALAPEFMEEPVALAAAVEEGQEEEADLMEFEPTAQAMARTIPDEPRVVPMAATPAPRPTPRLPEERPRPIVRKEPPKDEPNEEQFYLEPV